MTMPFRRVAVIGAGVMGAGIAAQVANAGLPVLLLDVVAEGSAGRNAVAETALARLLKAEPAAFMHPRAARLVTPGNVEDDLHRLADCDWIVEAVVERPEVKRAIYRRIAAHRRPDAVVSSNTSTLPLAVLTEGMPDDMAANFLVTHFFNPPRYMRLLEVVAGPRTRPEATERLRAFADQALGKTVIACRDTPGFVANRIGVYWLQAGMVHAVEDGLTVEEADAVVGPPAGIPKSGIFGLLDLVGLDLIPQIGGALAAALPADDPLRAILRPLPVVERMIAEGRTGRKGAGGFYRVTRGAGGKVKEAVDLATGEYRPARKVRGEAEGGGLDALLARDDKAGRYAWKVLGGTLAYAAALIPEIADDIAEVDAAMRLGYGWREGPFAMIDRLGPARFAARLEADGRPVPPLLRAVGKGTFYRVADGRLQRFAADGTYREVARPAGVLLLSDVKLRSRPLAANGSASLWDIGDGVMCLELHGPKNAIDPDLLAMIRRSVDLVPATGGKALVLHSEAENFAVGANIALALFAANIGLWPEIEAMVREGQETYRALRRAPFPVVGAPSGLALGGGCELLLHCDAVQAHAETYVGLVEAGVGVVPAWGGCTEMLRRWAAAPGLPRGPMPPVARVFETLSMATVARSAAEARDHLFLAPGDGITMNRDRLLADAKARALAMAETYAPPEPARFQLPGRSGRTALALMVETFRRQGKATAHDAVVAGHLAEVLCGGDVDLLDTVEEEDLLTLERRAFMALIRTPPTLARIENMLETGKPLRN